MSMVKSWIEAMRLRTLPVSMAGVVAGTACAVAAGGFSPRPCLICFLFALFAQIVSNFANEYFDFKNGLDHKGREGFRRGVTEGDISPRAMKRATFILLAFDCLLGASLIFWGGFGLIPVGIAIAVFALAYSAGPYPLSHHGLGEIAVIIFFGIVPVVFTSYVQTGDFSHLLILTLPTGLAVGLMAANVLIVNNYRDADDDRAVGKRTSVVILGRPAMRSIYLANGIIAILLLGFVTVAWIRYPWRWLLFLLVYANVHYRLWSAMGHAEGRELNPLLGSTASSMFVVALWLLLMFCL